MFLNTKVESPQTCAHCQKRHYIEPLNTMLQCSACLAAFYGSRECQELDVKTHSAACKVIAGCSKGKCQIEQQKLLRSILQRLSNGKDPLFNLSVAAAFERQHLASGPRRTLTSGISVLKLQALKCPVNYSKKKAKIRLTEIMSELIKIYHAEFEYVYILDGVEAAVCELIEMRLDQIDADSSGPALSLHWKKAWKEIYPQTKFQ